MIVDSIVIYDLPKHESLHIQIAAGHGLVDRHQARQLDIALSSGCVETPSLFIVDERLLIQFTHQMTIIVNILKIILNLNYRDHLNLYSINLHNEF